MERDRGNLTRKRLNSYTYKALLPLIVEEIIDLSYAKPLVFSYHVFG